MEGIQTWQVIAYLSALQIVIAAVLAVYERRIARNIEFLNRCQHEETRGEIDRVRRWVEPETEPPPQKRITGLMPPMGPQ